MGLTDVEYEAQKARVNALVDQWVKPIGLGWWRIDICWERDDPPLSQATPHFRTLMSCRAEWKYLLAEITVYLAAIRDLDDERLEYAFVHELMHIFLAEMRVTSEDEAEHQRDHEERVATTLAQALLWLRDSVREEAEANAAMPRNRAERAENRPEMCIESPTLCGEEQALCAASARRNGAVVR